MSGKPNTPTAGFKSNCGCLLQREGIRTTAGGVNGIHYPLSLAGREKIDCNSMPGLELIVCDHKHECGRWLDEVMRQNLVKPSTASFLVCVILTSSKLNFHIRVRVIHAT